MKFKNFDTADVFGPDDVEQAKGYIGKLGYFEDDLNDLDNAIAYSPEQMYKLVRIKQIDCDEKYVIGACGFKYFLPLDKVKKTEPVKKYRPLKSIDEMDCLFDCSVMSAKNFLTYRNKASGKIYIELLFSVCRDKDDILLSINNIPVKNLFNYFEIRKNGEWLPFGVEVEDD